VRLCQELADRLRWLPSPAASNASADGLKSAALLAVHFRILSSSRPSPFPNHHRPVCDCVLPNDRNLSIQIERNSTDNPCSICTRGRVLRSALSFDKARNLCCASCLQTVLADESQSPDPACFSNVGILKYHRDPAQACGLPATAAPASLAGFV
jgi:hypothetical protein